MHKRTISRRLWFGACVGRVPGTRLRRGLALLLGRRLRSLFGTSGAQTRPVKDKISILLLLSRTELFRVIVRVLVVQGI